VSAVNRVETSEGTTITQVRNSALIAVGDEMFLEMQDFDFCPNLIKF